MIEAKGAFSSLIFLPLTAWLVQATSWRVTLTIDAAAVGVSFLLAAIVVLTAVAFATAALVL